jgi:hypothetical protein
VVKRKISKKSATKETTTVKMDVPVIVTCDENGDYHAELPVIKGYSEGKTREEALKSMKKVVRLCQVPTSESCDIFCCDHIDSGF